MMSWSGIDLVCGLPYLASGNMVTSIIPLPRELAHTDVDGRFIGPLTTSWGHVLFSYLMHNVYIKLVRNCLISDIYLLFTGYTRIFPSLMVE